MPGTGKRRVVVGTRPLRNCPAAAGVRGVMEQQQLVTVLANWGLQNWITGDKRSNAQMSSEKKEEGCPDSSEMFLDSHYVHLSSYL